MISRMAAFLIALAIPAWTTVDTQDGERLEKGVGSYLAERSSTGKRLSEAQRKKISAAVRQEFEKHSRRFSSAEISLFLKLYGISLSPGPQDSAIPDEAVDRYVQEIVPAEVDSFAKWRDWYPENAGRAREQLLELAEYTASTLSSVYPEMDKNPDLQRCILAYFKREEGKAHASVADALRSWLKGWIERSLEEGRYREVLKRDGNGDGTMEEKKSKISAYIRSVRDRTKDPLNVANLIALATRGETLEGAARDRYESWVGGLLAADLLVRAAFKLAP